jgi:hypothetical protein
MRRTIATIVATLAIAIGVTASAAAQTSPEPVPADSLTIDQSSSSTANPSRFVLVAADQSSFPNGRTLQDDVFDTESSL